MSQKATNLTVTRSFLLARERRAKGFPQAKWIYFCHLCLDSRFEVSLYEARKTFSKYVTVDKEGRTFKVRFSNHKPIKQRELKGDCDFFVGYTHTGIRTTEQAIFAMAQFFQLSPGRR